MQVNIAQESRIFEEIALRASTPTERLQQHFAINVDASSSDTEARVKRLCQILGAENDEKINVFLSQQHLDQQQLSCMLLTPRFSEPGELPLWAQTLKIILQDFKLYAQGDQVRQDRCLIPEHPVPFEDLLLPFVCFARQQLQSLATRHYLLFSESAHKMLEHWLLQSLSLLAGQCLQLEFSLLRLRRDPFRLLSSEKAKSNHLYQSFISHCVKDGMMQFFLEYSVLARLLVLQTRQWIETYQDLLAHLEADRDEISRVFFSGQKIGAVVDIKAGCSDSHHNGRTVHLLSYSSGLKLVYKPRCLDTDKAFTDLLIWVETHIATPGFKVARILSRATYGWMEYVEHTDCKSLEEVKRYYQRAGMLLCLLYALNGTDCHRENLIACGEHPVLIDLETLLHRQFASAEAKLKDVRPPAYEQEQSPRSVLSTGILPVWVSPGKGEKSFDVSGLGSVTEEESSQRVPQWKHVNTDAMVLTQQYVRVRQSTNAVMIEQSVVAPYNYTEEIVKGFRTIYNLFVARKAEVLAPGGPLALFARCPIRCIFRNTHIYFTLLKKLVHPDYLRDGAYRWLELNILRKPLLETDLDASAWQVTEAEIRSLEQLDIPFFTSWTDSNELRADDGAVFEGVFAESSIGQIRQHLISLNNEDCERQVGFIRASFFTTMPLLEASLGRDLSEASEGQVKKGTLTQEELLAAASTIADELKMRAIYRYDKTATWLNLCYEASLNRYHLSPMGYNVYDGVCGIALFLATLEQVTGDTRNRQLIEAALKPLCDALRPTTSTLSENELSTMGIVGIGSALGIGSLVYALARIGQQLHAPEFLECALRAALLITQQQIEADRIFDVTTGSAGAILGLLALYEILPDPMLLEKALACGRHLLARRIQTYPGGRSWPYPFGKPLTGFSHGVAGIVYALLQLSLNTGLPEFHDAAEEALGYEQYAFSPEAGNWPDYREQSNVNEQTHFKVSWCHGAPGIGLARLGGLPGFDTALVRQDIEAALATTQSFGLPQLDNLCCGNFGRLELFNQAAKDLQRPHLLAMAREKASALVHNALQRGAYYMFPNLPPQAYHPGLFQGSSGIGYSLLRLAYPDKIPSILLWK